MQLVRLGPSARSVPPSARTGSCTPSTRSPATSTARSSRPTASAGSARALAAGALPVLDGADERRVGAPVARPTAVVCIGMNYAEHAAESGSAPPDVPIVFWKHSNTVVGPHDDVLVPPGATTVDWEVELGVVIGRRARYLSSPEEALDHVAGYVLSHDVSERDYQMKVSGGQWSKGKSCETFNPLGPWLVPADEVDVQNLGLRSWVNGEPRQDSTTADMIFDVASLVHHLSQYMVLEPGDLINTGTPQGVAPLRALPLPARGRRRHARDRRPGPRRAARARRRPLTTAGTLSPRTAGPGAPGPRVRHEQRPRRGLVRVGVVQPWREVVTNSRSRSSPPNVHALTCDTGSGTTASSVPSGSSAGPRRRPTAPPRRRPPRRP